MPLVNSNPPPGIAGTALLPQDAQHDSTLNASKVARYLIEKTCLHLLKSGLGPKPESMVISPVSIAPVLGMLLAGMEDQADKEKLLCLPSGSLTEELEAQIHRQLGAFSRANPFTNESAVATVNFLTSKYPSPSQAVIDTLQGAYHTEVQTVSQYSDIAKTTDEYVSRKTEGRITNAFGDSSETERGNVMLVLGNVLNFEGFWEESFEKSKTSTDKFYCLDGSVINNVQMMHQHCNLKFADCYGFEAVAKPFHSDDGKPLNLVVIKPFRNGISSLSDLSSRVINNLIHNSTHACKQAGYLDLPRIQIKHTDRELLEKLASATGFEITSKDLGKLNMSVDDVLSSHSTINVSLDEAGARGSVVTIAKSTTRSSVMLPHFTLDRPGYFAIVDDSGKRLVEALITDGQFLATSGPASITPPFRLSDEFDALSNSISFLGGQGHSDPVDIEKSSKNADPVVKTRPPLDTWDKSELVNLVQSKLNPGGELIIRDLFDRADQLRIVVRSQNEARALQKKILELIGIQYASTVSCVDFYAVVDVILNKSGREQLFKYFREHDSEPPAKPGVGKKSNKSIESVVGKNPQDPDILLQYGLSPDGELNITRVTDFPGDFRLEVNSRNDAETLQRKIVQLIGLEHAGSVSIYEYSVKPVVDVIVDMKFKERLIKRLRDQVI